MKHPTIDYFAAGLAAPGLALPGGSCFMSLVFFVPQPEATRATNPTSANETVNQRRERRTRTTPFVLETNADAGVVSSRDPRGTGSRR